MVNYGLTMSTSKLPQDKDRKCVRLRWEDDQLVERLAELAQVGHWVAQHAVQIDKKPIPECINSLLSAAEPVQKDNVVHMSLWRKLNVATTRHAALAAGIALFFAIGVNTWMQDEVPGGNNAVASHIASILDQHTSGQSIAAEDGSEVLPYFSFENKQGQYCRHYQLKDVDSSSANIACRDSHQWTVVASVETAHSEMEGQYQAAAAEHHLTEVIDNISKGPVFDLAQEQAAIANTWQTNNK